MEGLDDWKQKKYWEKIKASPLPMKWAVALPILFIINAVMSADDGLKVISLVTRYPYLPLTVPLMGFFDLAKVVTVLMTCINLWRFKKAGYEFAYAVYACNILYCIVSILALTELNSDSSAISGLATNIVGSIVGIVANKKYFDRRKDLYS